MKLLVTELSNIIIKSVVKENQAIVENEFLNTMIHSLKKKKSYMDHETLLKHCK